MSIGFLLLVYIHLKFGIVGCLVWFSIAQIATTLFSSSLPKKAQAASNGNNIARLGTPLADRLDSEISQQAAPSPEYSKMCSIWQRGIVVIFGGTKIEGNRDPQPRAASR